MRSPVFQEQRLGNFSATPEFGATLPLGPTSKRAHSQGLQLATNRDVLIGRSDNGVIISKCPESSRLRLAVSGCVFTGMNQTLQLWVLVVLRLHPLSMHPVLLQPCLRHEVKLKCK